MKENRRNERPLAGDQGRAEKAQVTNLTLPLQYSTLTSDCQEFGIARIFRIRDALVALENRIGEARRGFEAEIAGILGGEGDD